MRDPKALPYDHCPLRQVTDSVIGRVVPAPATAVFFRRIASGAIVASIVLLGSYMADLTVETEGRDLPEQAWLKGPMRPNGDPRTTFAELVSGFAAERVESKG
jgi:hypothetical protein